MSEFKVGDMVVNENGDVCRIEKIEGMMYQLLCRPDGPYSFLYWQTGTDELRSLEPLRQSDQTFHRDAGKPDPTLIPSAALMQVIGPFEHGLEKGYKARSWRQVPDAQARYLASLMRHAQAVLTAVQDGEEGGLMVLDPDGGRPHLAAIAADALILLDLGLREEGK